MSVDRLDIVEIYCETISSLGMAVNANSTADAEAVFDERAIHNNLSVSYYV